MHLLRHAAGTTHQTPLRPAIFRAPPLASFTRALCSYAQVWLLTSCARAGRKSLQEYFSPGLAPAVPRASSRLTFSLGGVLWESSGCVRWGKCEGFCCAVLPADKAQRPGQSPSPRPRGIRGQCWCSLTLPNEKWKQSSLSRGA